MSKPCHSFRDRSQHVPGWQGKPVDQDDGQAKGAGCGQLGFGTRTARVLGDDKADPMVAQQGKVGGKVKGAARDDSLDIGQRKRAFGRVDKAQKVVVLGLCGEGLKGLFADGEEDPCGRLWQGSNGGFCIWHMGPSVAGLGAPRRAFQGNQRKVQFGAGVEGIAAHPRSEGVGRVDDMADALIFQVGDQPRHAAKATYPLGQGLRHGCRRSAGVGKDRIRPGIGKRAGKRTCLGRAAQKKGAWHG